MHPDIARALAAAHHGDLIAAAQRQRRARHALKPA